MSSVFRPPRLALSVLGALFLLYVVIGLSGFGTDADTYLMLRTWDLLVTQAQYFPSRSPGYPLPEILIGAATFLGGYPLANTLSAAFACLALACFHRLLWAAGVSASAALVCLVAVGLNPYWVIAASSSMDYVYAAGFFLLGVELLRRGRLTGSAVAFAAAAASRATYAPLALIALMAHPFPWPLRSRLAVSQALRILLFVALTGLAYWPVYHVWGLRRMFLVHMGGPVDFVGTAGFASPMDYAVRLTYKNVMLWGPFGFALLAGGLLAGILFRASRETSRAPLALAVTIAIASGLIVCELFFLRMPVEVSYLLPVLFVGVFALARLPRALLFATLLAVLQAVQGITAFDLLFIERDAITLDVKPTAKGARLDPRFVPGVVVGDLKARGPRQEFLYGRIFGDRSLRFY